MSVENTSEQGNDGKGVSDDCQSLLGPPSLTGTGRLLEYELTMFTDLQLDDGLLITAKYAHFNFFVYMISDKLINN